MRQLYDALRLRAIAGASRLTRPPADRRVWVDGGPARDRRIDGGGVRGRVQLAAYARRVQPERRWLHARGSSLMGFLGFGRPNVERLAAKGDVEGLVRAAKYKKDPVLAEAARQALEDQLEFFVVKLGSRNLRRVVLSREALKLIGEPSVTLLSDVIVNGDVGKRCDAAFALGEVGLPSGLPALEKGLRDKDPRVRVLAVKSLARFDDERVPALLERACRDRDEAVRYHAGKARKRLEK